MSVPTKVIPIVTMRFLTLSATKSNSDADQRLEAMNIALSSKRSCLTGRILDFCSRHSEMAVAILEAFYVATKLARLGV